MQELISTIDVVARRAFDKGKAKAKQAFEDMLTEALKGGAGPAHKITAAGQALPPSG